MSAIQITYTPAKSKDEQRRALVIVRGGVVEAVTEFGIKYRDAHILKAEELRAEVIIEEDYPIRHEPD